MHDLDVGYEHIDDYYRHQLIRALEAKWVRDRTKNKRIAYGDDFAADAWRNNDTLEIKYTVVGINPLE